MTGSARDTRATGGGGISDVSPQYKRDFWIAESDKFVNPHFRLRKAARIITEIAQGNNYDLLDVGCGPSTLMGLLPGNINYYGIDIAIPRPAPNLIEADFLESPIEFGDKRFDIVVVLGVLEYLGTRQDQKLAELRQLLKAGGTAVLTYTNFDHRNRHVYEAYSNVQAMRDFRESLTRHFKIDRSFPASHNWKHGQPHRRVMKVIQMPARMNIPVVSPVLGVEYFFVCS